MYNYIITENFVINIYDKNGILIDYPGPYISYEAAQEMAEILVNALNDGSIKDPRDKGDE